MLKGVLETLKGIKYGDYTETLNIDNEFNYLIPDTRVYTMYTLKFEVSRNDFKVYLKDIIDVLEIFEYDEYFLEKTLEVTYRWYCHYLEHKNLHSSTNSLKSELKKLYKRRTGGIEKFDRFFETILNAIQEASNIYDVVFYYPEAILRNKGFTPDRESCYITSRPDYLTALKQSNVYYVLIYKNHEPITRVWFVANKSYENAVIFNLYGHKFRNLGKFFSIDGELEVGSHRKLESALGVYINDDIILTTTSNYNTFVYRLCCPTCHNYTSSNQLIMTYDEEEKEYKLRCFTCADNVVYSEISNSYILDEDALYSEYHDTYIHKDDAVYSYYLDDHIHESIAMWVWNSEIDGYDYVPNEMAVYSSHYVDRLIKEQTVYSCFYGTYLLKDDAVYCEEVDSYVDRKDGRFTEIDEKCVTTVPIYIPVHT